MSEEELLSVFYDAVNGKTKRGHFHVTDFELGKTIVLDKIYAIMKRIRDSRGESEYRQVVENVRDSIQEAGDTEAMNWWYKL